MYTHRLLEETSTYKVTRDTLGASTRFLLESSNKGKDPPAKTAAIAVALYGNMDTGAGLKQLVGLLWAKGLRVREPANSLVSLLKKFHGLTAEGTAGLTNNVDLAVARELGSEVLKKGLEGSEVTTVSAKPTLRTPICSTQNSNPSRRCISKCTTNCTKNLTGSENTITQKSLGRSPRHNIAFNQQIDNS